LRAHTSAADSQHAHTRTRTQTLTRGGAPHRSSCLSPKAARRRTSSRPSGARPSSPAPCPSTSARPTCTSTRPAPAAS
jgi:hypothetical protein